jgi:hypothetical protein
MLLASSERDPVVHPASIAPASTSGTQTTPGRGRAHPNAHRSTRSHLPRRMSGITPVLMIPTLTNPCRGLGPLDDRALRCVSLSPERAASPDLMRSLLATVINALLSADADAVCGAEYGQSTPDRVTCRNGCLHRIWTLGSARSTWATQCPAVKRYGSRRPTQDRLGEPQAVRRGGA